MMMKIQLMFKTMLFFMSLVLFFFSLMLSPILLEFELFSLNSCQFSFIFLIDWMSLMFGSFVLIISFMIMNYSDYYMKGDMSMMRFIIMMLLFILSMMFLIFGGNFFSILIGWDGLGLTSFCLVIYYFDKASMASGVLTIMLNRLGDGLILMSIYMFCSLSTDILSSSFTGALLLLIAFLTKSAQLPFSVWLPFAMAAPTPISSLVHSSTLVTAGVYLSIRFNFIFSSYCFSVILSLLSLLTMLVGGVMANLETDFKKIIAMSTLSQLGLLFFLISINMIKIAFFHMLTHALFKSLLFMSTGKTIFDGSQDSRIKGNNLITSPLIALTFMVSLMSLMATPFLIGFYSKDIAIDFFMSHNLTFLFTLTFILGSLLTVIYSSKIMILILPSLVYSVMNANTSSFKLYMSITSSFLLNIFMSKMLFDFVLMEEFVLMSFPFKMTGLFLLISGLLITILWKSFSHLQLIYSTFWWFKGLMKNIKHYHTLYKNDQLHIEPIIFKYLMDNLKMVQKLENMGLNMTWLSIPLSLVVLIMLQIS